MYKAGSGQHESYMIGEVYYESQIVEIFWALLFSEPSGEENNLCSKNRNNLKFIIYTPQSYNSSVSQNQPYSIDNFIALAKNKKYKEIMHWKPTSPLSLFSASP